MSQITKLVPNKSVQAITACTAHTTPTIPQDDSIPQIGEGVDVGFSLAITTQTAGSKVSGKVNIFGAPTVNAALLIIAVFRDSGANSVGPALIRESSELHTYVVDFVDEPGAAGTYTYTVRLGVSSGNFTVNGTAGVRFLGGAAQSTLKLEEILP